MVTVGGDKKQIGPGMSMAGVHKSELCIARRRSKAVEHPWVGLPESPRARGSFRPHRSAFKEAVDNRQHAQLLPVVELVRDKIHRPYVMRGCFGRCAPETMELEERGRRPGKISALLFRVFFFVMEAAGSRRLP